MIRKKKREFANFFFHFTNEFFMNSRGPFNAKLIQVRKQVLRSDGSLAKIATSFDLLCNSFIDVHRIVVIIRLLISQKNVL